MHPNYIEGAIQWANDPAADKSGAYQDWSGTPYRRLRDVLKVIAFSANVTPRVLDGFIYWNAAEVIEAEVKESAAEQKGAEQKPGEEAPELAQVTSRDALTSTPRGEFTSIPPDPFNPAYWISIPAGSFVMGSRDDNKSAQDNERPQHSVTLKDYRLARYPVTNENFAAFVSAAKYKSEAVQSDKPDHPVVNVSWLDAVAYCQWLTQELQTKKIITPKEIVRLPTEAEWEKAARGEFGKEYPWGDAFDAAKCNTRESGIGGTSPVGKFSPQGDSPYGVADMAGNVWEWVSSVYKAYSYDATDGREDPNANALRVVRGGSCDNISWYCRAACRSRHDPAYFDFNLGFRVAVSPSRV